MTGSATRAGLDDSFYEGKWATSDRSCGSLRNFLVKKERFFLRWLRGRKGRLLDLGCGGGWAWFAAGRSAVGVDVSRASLRVAARLYHGVALARWDALPFRDGSFDYVVSSDVLGHVPVAEKDRVLAELRRVLAPGGLMLHYVETDSADPLMRFAKRRPDLYERYVLAPEGHVGMETPAATFSRFRRAGLEPLTEQAAYRLFMYVQRLSQLFDNEYRGDSRVVDLLVRLAATLRRRRLGMLAGNLLMSVAMEIADYALPASWANGVLVAYREPRGSPGDATGVGGTMVRRGRLGDRA